MNLTHIPAPHRATIFRLYKGGDVLRPQLDDFDIDILHAAVGISTEAGEMLESILPMHLTNSYSMGGRPSCRGVDGAPGIRRRNRVEPWEDSEGGPGVDIENVVEEAGDHLFYEGALRIATLLELLGMPDDVAVTLGLWPMTSPGPLACANNPEIGRKRVLVDLIMIHAALAGKILDVVKRKVIYRKPFDTAAEGEVSLKDRLRQHLIDDAWVLEQLAALIGRSEEDLREANIVKLEKGKDGKKARYADGYSDAAAVQRADKEGEEVRDLGGIGVTFGNPDGVKSVQFVSGQEESKSEGASQ